MSTPFPSTVPHIIKIEDGSNVAASGQVPSDEDLRIMDMFKKGVQRRLELRRKGHCASFSVQAQPAPPPPVQQPPPLPLPPPLPPPPAQRTWAKRPAGPPSGLNGVRQPPQKHYQRRPPLLKAQHAPHPAPNAQRSPGPSCPAPPVNAGSGVPPANAMKPPLKPRSAAKLPHPAAKKKPTVPCVFCGVLCRTAWHLKQHEQGRKHLNRVAYLAGEMNVRCQVCNVHLSSGLNVEQHYAGKRHLRRLNGA